MSASNSTVALVVSSPATMATPVFTSVSTATRERLSCASTASTTASEIASAILSGCPSDTDSDVNRKLLAIWVIPPVLNEMKVSRRSLEALRQPLLELLAREPVILRAARLDLDGAHQRGDTAG